MKKKQKSTTKSLSTVVMFCFYINLMRHNTQCCGLGATVLPFCFKCKKQRVDGVRYRKSKINVEKWCVRQTKELKPKLQKSLFDGAFPSPFYPCGASHYAPLKCAHHRRPTST